MVYSALWTVSLIFSVFLYFAAELGCIAYCHNLCHSSMEFIMKYTKQVRTVNSILDILCKAPVFANFQVGASVNSVVIVSKCE
jgi:hypothetical protein